MRFLLIVILAGLGYLGWGWYQERQKVVALEAEITALQQEIKTLKKGGSAGGANGWRERREKRWKTPQQAADGPVTPLEQMSPEEKKTFGR